MLLVISLLLTGCGSNNISNNNESNNVNSENNLGSDKSISFDIEVMNDFTAKEYLNIIESDTTYLDNPYLYMTVSFRADTQGSWLLKKDVDYNCGQIRHSKTYDETIKKLNEFEQCYNSKVQSANTLNESNKEEIKADFYKSFGYSAQSSAEEYFVLFPRDKNKVIEFTKELISSWVDKYGFKDSYYHYSIYPIVYNNKLINIEIIEESVPKEDKDKFVDFREAALNLNKNKSDNYEIEYAGSNGSYSSNSIGFDRLYGDKYGFPFAIVSYRDDVTTKNGELVITSVKRDYLSMLMDGKNSEDVRKDYNQYTKTYSNCENCNI